MVSTRAGRSGVALIALMVLAASVAAACGGGSGSGSASNSAAVTPSATEELRTEPTAAEPTNAPPSPMPTDTPVPPTPMDPMDGLSSSIPSRIEIEARDNVFDVQPAQGAPGTIEAPANSDFTVRLVNEGVLPHNIAFFTEQGGAVLAEGANSAIILEAESTSITFGTPAPGTYYFQCTVHPLEMYGEFVVESGA